MVQRRAVRWSLNNYFAYSSVSQMQQQLGWQSLDQRRADYRLCMPYKITHGMVAIEIPSYFEQAKATTHQSLRHPLVYRQIHTPANYHKYSFFSLAVVLWNRLPPSTVVLRTLTQFSAAVRSLDHHLPSHSRPVLI